MKIKPGRKIVGLPMRCYEMMKSPSMTLDTPNGDLDHGHASGGWCDVEFRVAFGSAVEEILSAASGTKRSLIIMGAQKRKTFAGHKPLTIAYDVATKAECPVLTVRAGSA